MSKKGVWQVIDTTSSCMPSMKRVIGEFETLAAAETLSKNDERFRVRMKPEVRSRKGEGEDDES